MTTITINKIIVEAIPASTNASLGRHELPLQLSIYDINGHLVKTISSKTNTFTLTAHNMASGIYFIKANLELPTDKLLTSLNLLQNNLKYYINKERVQLKADSPYAQDFSKRTTNLISIITNTNLHNNEDFKGRLKYLSTMIYDDNNNK